MMIEMSPTQNLWDDDSESEIVRNLWLMGSTTYIPTTLHCNQFFSTYIGR